MRYQTIDTNSGLVVDESNRHPLTQQLERRMRSSKRRSTRRWYISRAERHIAFAAALCAIVGVMMLVERGVL